MSGGDERADTDIVIALAYLVNSERQQRGLYPLQLFDPLAATARQRVGEIDERLLHSRTDGLPADFTRSSSGIWTRTGENLAFLDAAAPPSVALGVHQMIMLSPVHRANVLSPEFRFLGVAASERDGRWYVVQLFAG